jgi:hypothetical protein
MDPPGEQCWRGQEQGLEGRLALTKISIPINFARREGGTMLAMPSLIGACHIAHI